MGSGLYTINNCTEITGVLIGVIHRGRGGYKVSEGSCHDVPVFETGSNPGKPGSNRTAGHRVWPMTYALLFLSMMFESDSRDGDRVLFAIK